MLKVDIISNYHSRYIPTFKNNSNLYPLFAFQKQLHERGIYCDFCSLDQNNERRSARIALVDSRVFPVDRSVLSDSSLEELESLRKKYDLLIWFDTRDSSGTTNFEVLSLVDKYCKKSFLKDKSLYEKRFRDCRIYTDFYCTKYEIQQYDECADSSVLAGESEKLVLGWNLAYSDFNSQNRASRYMNIIRDRWSPTNFGDVDEKRTIDLQSRFTETYDSEAISFHRKSFAQISDQLKHKGYEVRTGQISKDSYLAELGVTRAVMSPFGWGEICFRDFEAMLAGCALVKPDCRHLETWPDMFVEGETYLPLPWEPEAVSERLTNILEDGELIEYVATQGQKLFKHVWSDTGIQQFCDHFSELVCG